MKFSVIIPTYNTEKYLVRCIESVLNQTYTNFEIIIINDGSTDSTESLLKKYDNSDKIKLITQSNHGLSYSRNVGIKNATGDYIVFVDSDDFISVELLESLNKNITEEDMVKFSYCELKNDSTIVYPTICFKQEDGRSAFEKMIESGIMIEMAWLYAYKASFIKNFQFAVGKYHEDFGLIPLMLIKANKVSSIDYVGYNYNRENESSITAFTNIEKEYKKASDTLYFFNSIKNHETDRYLLSFYSNGAISRIKNLKGDFKKKYFLELKKAQVYNYVLDNTLKRKIKKFLLKIRFCIFKQ